MLARKEASIKATSWLTSIGKPLGTMASLIKSNSTMAS